MCSARDGAEKSTQKSSSCAAAGGAVFFLLCFLCPLPGRIPIPPFTVLKKGPDWIELQPGSWKTLYYFATFIIAYRHLKFMILEWCEMVEINNWWSQMTFDFVLCQSTLQHFAVSASENVGAVTKQQWQMSCAICSIYVFNMMCWWPTCSPWQFQWHGFSLRQSLAWMPDTIIVLLHQGLPREASISYWWLSRLPCAHHSPGRSSLSVL